MNRHYKLQAVIPHTPAQEQEGACTYRFLSVHLWGRERLLLRLWPQRGEVIHPGAGEGVSPHFRTQVLCLLSPLASWGHQRKETDICNDLVPPVKGREHKDGF